MKLLLIILLIISIFNYKKTIYYLKKDFNIKSEISLFLLIIGWIYILLLIIF